MSQPGQAPGPDGAREQPRGGVVVAVAAVVVREQRVLLVQRAKAPAAGRWSLPGGHLLLGETLHDGVVRELAEETSLTAQRVGRLLDVVEIIRPGIHYLILPHLVEVAREATAAAGSDAAGVAWVSRQELDSLETTERLREFLEAHSVFS